jgi:hypothetical protein
MSNGTTRNRGIWYNHSTFIDLIIAALVGLRTAATGAAGAAAAAASSGAAAAAAGGTDTDSVTVFPLAAGMDYFALDNLRVRGHALTIVWDKAGTRYPKTSAGVGGVKGLSVWVDGKLAASAPALAKLDVKL